jgi:aquaporin Z
VRKYTVEFLGTFFLTFTICTSVISGAPLAPLAIGGVLAALVFAGGHISGAHYNPAVTVAVVVRGRLSSREIAPYIGSQLLGALLAGLIGRLVVGHGPGGAFTAHGRFGAAAVAELLVTFALAYVVLNVATSKDHPGNSFYGLAIGLTVLAGAVSVGGISGGVFNPAVGVGVVVSGILSPILWGIYVVVQCLGGAAAGLVFRLLNPDDVAPEVPVEAPAEASLPAPRGALADDVLSKQRSRTS